MGGFEHTILPAGLSEDEYIEAVRQFSEGKKHLVAHISDTPTDMYSLCAKFLRAAAPEYTVHTGDLADEFKAGRRPEHVKPYVAAVPGIINVMRRLGGKVMYTVGNNDVRSAIGGIEEVGNGSVLDLAGVRFLVDHVPPAPVFDADIALFGHNSNEDMHYSLICVDGVLYLNGNFRWSVIDTENRKVLSMPVRLRSDCIRIFTMVNAHENNGVPSSIGKRQLDYTAYLLKRIRFDGRIYTTDSGRASANRLRDVFRCAIDLIEAEDSVESRAQKDILIVGTAEEIRLVNKRIMKKCSVAADQMIKNLSSLHCSISQYRFMGGSRQPVMLSSTVHIPVRLTTSENGYILKTTDSGTKLPFGSEI